MSRFMYQASVTANMLDISIALFMIFGVVIFERTIATRPSIGRHSPQYGSSHG